MSKLTKEERGPTLCWHCGRHLQWMCGGAVSFTEVIAPGGAEVRTHKDGARKAVEDGARLKTPSTGNSAGKTPT